MNLDLVLGSASDTGPVISELSRIASSLLKAGRRVIHQSSDDVKASQMAKALTRASRKSDKRIRRVELRDLAYTMIVRSTGEAVFRQFLPMK